MRINTRIPENPVLREFNTVNGHGGSNSRARRLNQAHTWTESNTGADAAPSIQGASKFMLSGKYLFKFRRQLAQSVIVAQSIVRERFHSV